MENENKKILNIFFLSSPQKKDGPNIAIRLANGNSSFLKHSLLSLGILMTPFSTAAFLFLNTD